MNDIEANMISSNLLLQALLDDIETGRCVVDELDGQLPPLTPPRALRTRLLSSIAHSNRFERFIPQVAEALDLPGQHADALLRGLDDEAAWRTPIGPGAHMQPVQGGAAVQGAMTAFLRVEAGGSIPDHEHGGDEFALVLQGRCVSSHDARVLEPGSVLQMPEGSAHRLDVLEGPRCLLLLVGHGGVRMLPQASESNDEA